MSELKRITVVRGGSGKKTRLEIEPGTTAKDILEKVGLDAGYLRAPDEAAAFDAADDVFARVADGDKLLATPFTPVEESACSALQSASSSV
jgi:hypothetical protein